MIKKILFLGIVFVLFSSIIHANPAFENYKKKVVKAEQGDQTALKNLCDILNLNQLATITSADGIARKAIKEGMAANLHYKDIYQLAKKRVEAFAELHGKTFIPAIQQIEYEAKAKA